MNQIATTFDARSLGGSFQEVAVDVIRGESTDFVSRWFKAARGDADLTIWVDGEHRIVKHQLSFFGQVVEWNPIQGTRTGFIVEVESAEAMSDSTMEDPELDGVAEIIRFDEKVQISPVAQAIDLLSHVPSLSEKDRASLIYNFRESPRLHKNARERALKAWALQGEEPILTDKRPSFWRRLRRWVLGSESR